MQTLSSSSHRQGEAGQAAVELAIALMVLVLLMGGVLALGPLMYTNVAINTAAYDCAVAAAQSLNPEQSRYQGITAAQETLARQNLRATAAQIGVYSDWRRGSPVVCQVQYKVNLEGVPLVNYFNIDPVINYRVALPAQAFKSVWK